MFQAKVFIILWVIKMLSGNLCMNNNEVVQILSVLETVPYLAVCLASDRGASNRVSGEFM